MKFSKKVKQFKEAGFKFEVNEEEDIISINLAENNLFIRDYQTGKLNQTESLVKSHLLTFKELVERESETLESCYFDEFEATLKDKYKNLDLIIDSLFSDSEKISKKLSHEQILNRYLTKYNCITLGDSELIADKFYLVIY